MTYLGIMKTRIKSTTLKLHKALRKKIGESGFKSNQDFEKSAGLFEGLNISAKNLRKKAWGKVL